MTHAAMSPQEVMNHHAKSFSWAARFLSPAARRDAALLYAFARTADDYADEDSLGTWQERLQCLQQLRSDVLQAHTSPAPTLAQQAGRMLQGHGVPGAVIECFMDSLLADTAQRSLQTEQELLRFAYGVAGTVGQMMRPLLGAPAQAEGYAIALGVAMQLTNIARDVVEDAARGRCYIPAQWGVSPQTLAAPQTPAQRNEAFAAIQRLLRLADDFYVYAQTGFHAIPRHNRRAIRIALALYQAIGHKIAQRGVDRFWQGRVSLGSAEKSSLLARTLLTPQIHRPRARRDVWRSDLSHLCTVPGFPAGLQQ